MAALLRRSVSAPLVHIVAAAVGLSALLAASSMAFVIVKYAGAAYLCYAGLRMLFSRGRAEAAATREEGGTMGAVFWQGALTNALNPKVALFFLAFLPQFVDAAAPSKALAFLLLGLLFDLNGTIWNLGVAAVAARMGRALRTSALSAWISRTLGGMFIYLGVRLALFEQR